MCTTVFIDGNDVGSLDDLAKLLGGRDRLKFYRGYKSKDWPEEAWGGCLCGLNVERTARENGYRSRRDRHDSMMHHWSKAPSCPS